MDNSLRVQNHAHSTLIESRGPFPESTGHFTGPKP